MVTFKTKVYKVEEEDVIGAEVTIYSEAGDKIKEIYITSAEALNDLENRLTDLEARPVNQEQVIEIINNLAVNATTLEGRHSSDFAEANHTHNYAPIPHNSSNTNYGVGTSSQYGHVRVADNLLTSTFNSSSPVVLSARQGYLLSTELNKKVAKTDVVDNLNSSASNQPLSANQGRVLRNEINNLKDKNHDVDPLLLNSQWKDSNSWIMMRNGWAVISIYASLNLPEGQYIDEALNVVDINSPYWPVNFMEGTAQLVVPGEGRVQATIQVTADGHVHVFHGTHCTNNTLVFGTLVYPLKNYAGQ